MDDYHRKVTYYPAWSEDVQEAAKTQINPKVLEEKSLHLAFNAGSKDKAAKVAEAFKKIDGQKIVDEYIKANVK